MKLQSRLRLISESSPQGSKFVFQFLKLQSRLRLISESSPQGPRRKKAVTVTGAPPSLNDLARELGEESGPGHVNHMDIENNNATDKFPDEGDNDVKDANTHAENLPRKAIVHLILKVPNQTNRLYSLLLTITFCQAFKLHRSASYSGMRRAPTSFRLLVSENRGQNFTGGFMPL